VRFREFLNEATEEAHSLADIASIVHANKICFKYDGVYFSGSPQYHIRGFDSHSSSKIYYAGNSSGGTVRVFWLKGKKPFLVVRENVHGKPIEISVLNDADFVKAALGDVTDKDRILKILLKKYKDEANEYDRHDPYVIPKFEETKELFQTLLASLKKIVKWKELDAIAKSLNEAFPKGYFTDEKYSQERFLKKWMTPGFGHPDPDTVTLNHNTIMRGILDMFSRAVGSDSGAMRNIVRDMIEAARDLGFDNPDYKIIENKLDEIEA